MGKWNNKWTPAATRLQLRALLRTCEIWAPKGRAAGPEGRSGYASAQTRMAFEETKALARLRAARNRILAFSPRNRLASVGCVAELLELKRHPATIDNIGYAAVRAINIVLIRVKDMHSFGSDTGFANACHAAFPPLRQLVLAAFAEELAAGGCARALRLSIAALLLPPPPAAPVDVSATRIKFELVERVFPRRWDRHPWSDTFPLRVIAE